MAEAAETGRLNYQGVAVPDGVTLDAFKAMASLFNDFHDGLLLANGEEATHYVAAAMAFDLAEKELCKARRGGVRQG